MTGASQGIVARVRWNCAGRGHGSAGGAERSQAGRSGEEIAAAGGLSAAFVLDVANEASIKAGAKAAIERFGKVEILVNNAGITRDGLMLRMKRADWGRCAGHHLTGAFLLAQVLLGPC